ncbi:MULTISPECIES: hypothetical protein [unclassified Facklamia]|uniref:hypothetical protein n=1 Tax=Aerococcaceae TaxID=186827 RepID=UPI0013B91035|nr:MULTISPECIES: hypothetical protein [unclassified Facklamia]NEW64197.1 hypothetical protein [Facklamia sp. 252]NEW68284.1 hypothetical protein [Facklamia sp. 253]QQD65904.1 hypothetical protein JDW14_01920 [Aerococcaceae bacterium zg-252]
MDTIDEYVLDKLNLIESSISELAELHGHSTLKPVSASLFCLENGITFDERGKIILLLNRLFSEDENFSYLELKRNLIREVPKLALLSEEVFEGMVTIFKKIYVIEED